MEREVQSSKASLPKLFNIEFSSKVTVCNFLHESNAPKRIDSTLAGISIDSKPDEADPFSCLSENVHNSIVFNFDGFSKVMSNGLQTKTSIKSIFIYHFYRGWNSKSSHHITVKCAGSNRFQRIRQIQFF